MCNADKKEITNLVIAWRCGDRSAEEKLWPLVYDELKRMARRYLHRERADHTLQATALVHEAYLRLVDQELAQFKDRSHFFALAAKMMRRILVDYARQKGAAKRCGGESQVDVEGIKEASCERPLDLIAIEEALAALEAIDKHKALIVELRFFVGLSNREAGEVLGQSERTVQRHWQVAKAWLRREIQGEPHGS